MADFNGKSAVVLGVSEPDSMGAEIARRLLASGAKVLIAARREPEVMALAEALGAIGQRCDITSEDSVAALADRAKSEFGKLDFAVNAAGVAIMGDIAVSPEEDVRAAVDIHLVGPFFFFKHMPRAIEKDGAMITLSSVTAYRYIANHAAYMAAKAGTDHLVRIAAIEYAPKNIRVNSVIPGFTGDTPMAAQFAKVEGLIDLFERGIPLGRLNTAKDIAHAVMFFLDPETYVTGETLHVNGGQPLTRMPTREELASLMK